MRVCILYIYIYTMSNDLKKKLISKKINKKNDNNNRSTSDDYHYTSIQYHK